MNRDARLRRELDAYALPRPLAEVWPDALRVLAEHGAPLVGQDRAVAGQAEEGALSALLTEGYETRDLGSGRRAAESGPLYGRVRYRVEGVDLGRGASVVRYYTLQLRDGAAAEEASRALDLELALVRRVDLAAAERMATAAGG